MTWFDVAIQAAAMLVAAVAGWGGVPAVVDWLKAKLGWHGDLAALLAWGVSVLVAFLGLLGAGALAPEHFTLDRWPELILMVLTASQVAYQRRKRVG